MQTNFHEDLVVPVGDKDFSLVEATKKLVGPGNDDATQTETKKARNFCYNCFGSAGDKPLEVDGVLLCNE